MKEYQSTKNNPYLLPHHLYMRVLYIIRDYERLKEKADLLLSDIKTVTAPFSKTVDDCKIKNKPKRNFGAFKKQIFKEVDAIEGALEYIPDFYQSGVVENIINGSRYPLGADERTFRRYKQKYIFFVARLLELV